MQPKNNIVLNEKQQYATEQIDGPIMVIAGPGSGKTTVITHRIKNLICENNIPSENILVITFAKAAAEEMKKRFFGLIKNMPDMKIPFESFNVTFATFHSFFYRVIRSYYQYSLENILKEEERHEVIKQIIFSLGLNLDEEDDFLQNVSNEISLVKNELINIEYHNPLNLPVDSFRSIYKIYENWKDENNKIDFDDMLSKCYQLITSDAKILAKWRTRYQYIMIDEFQDINRIQYECIKLFSHPQNNIFVVGDDDQSIYRFRGSRPEFLLNFKNDFPKVQNIVLDINYRSSDSIIYVCNQVISNNKNRFQKRIRGTKIRGTKPVLLTHEGVMQEANYIAKSIKEQQYQSDLNEIAVVYRTNIQSRAFIDAFMDMRIPFQIKDEAPGIYEHWISKDIYAYFSLAINRSNNQALERVINKPSRYISKASISLAKKRGGSIFDNLYDLSTSQNRLIMRLEELTFYMNALKKRNAFDAIKYLRRAIGYDDYIKEYAEYKNISSKGMFEILNELQEAAKNYDDIGKYLIHIDKVTQEIQSAKSKGSNRIENAVTLSTMHGVKGLEYDTVYVASVIEGVIPHEKSKTNAELEEECRLLYVSMTRAKRNLFISVLKTRYEAEIARSRFLNVLTR